ncbi:MAG: phosphoribosyltransferase [Gammaproteobacteria bacterium]|nr:phosphoribosyltransferase [Gammaproteobacteria bacterium]
MTPGQTLRNIEVLSLAKIRDLSRRLARRIQADRFKPDIVIAIARGGFVPARLLCDYLDIYDLTGIRIAHYTGTEIQPQARLSIPLNIDVRAKTVLLVDDVDDTGDTLQLALEHLHGFAPTTVRVAVLHHKTTSRVVPDYLAEEVLRWHWITYPWAITEDVLGLVRKMQPVPTEVEEAVRRLAQDHGLRISKKVMEDVFRLLARKPSGLRQA